MAEWIYQTYEEFDKTSDLIALPKSSNPTDLKDRAIIKFTDESRSSLCDVERRPVYAVRGKPVPRALALEIIRKMDDYTRVLDYNPTYEQIPPKIQEMMDKVGLKRVEGLVHFNVADLTWFPKPDNVACGWLHPDGYIGIDGYCSLKNPFPNEIVYEWVYMIEEVTKDQSDKLDIVMVLTEQNEELKHGVNLVDAITTGLHIKGKTIEILNATKARMLFTKYDREYGDHTKNGPLVDPRKLSEDQIYHCDGFDTFDKKVRGIWTTGPTYCKYMLIWGDRQLLKPLPHMVDKNHPNYYGIPDYSLKTGPLTLDDMKEFLRKFAVEQESEKEGK